MYNTERFRFPYVSYKKNELNASIKLLNPLVCIYAYYKQS
jgi:hypothetical protein